ncbi:ATP-binding protein [Azospirillum oleiclasticum]|uniref:ATP-binding protein n=1 Tax=Azospirillum oleiclasticum TaxID=2735135 RepID=UPI0015D4CA74|nr:ATP-binding protein [Azospirillum oleiclasticum]
MHDDTAATGDALDRALIELGDRLRDLDDAAAVTAGALEVVGRALAPARAEFTDLDGGDGDRDGGAPSWPGRQWSGLADELRGGRVVVVGDTGTDPRTITTGRPADALRRALLVVPVELGGRTAAVLTIEDSAPRAWNGAEVTFARIAADRIWAAVAHTRALTRLKAGEERVQERTRALLHSEARFQGYFDASPEFLFLARITPDGRFVYEDVNPAGERQYGLSRRDIVGRSPEELWDRATAADIVRRARQCLKLGRPVRYETERRFNGQPMTLNVVVAPLEKGTTGTEGLFLYCGRDMTEQRLAEEQLRQSQKMEAIGQLTGGVAHDFNNLLQALTGCLQMIERRTGGAPAIRPLVEAGQQAIHRGARLIQQLMAFGRRQSLHPESLSLRDRVFGMSELLLRALRADIAIETAFAADLWPVEVDPTQLELAVINLAVNARDAMPAGGRLTVSAANLPGGDDAPDMVRLTVADTGTGMAPEVQARAFEPFYTTKEVGKGSGLGLAQVYGFTRQSGGRVEIDSAPGRGTSITLLLPRTTKPVSGTAPDLPAATGNRAGARVLLAEDDPVVASMVAAALEDAGYAVVRTGNAAEALEVLSSGAPVDLLFSDVVMPGAMNGIDLAHAARRARPGLPVVLTTGYSEDVSNIQDVHVLPKPYQIAELVTLLEAALGESPPPP